MDQRNPTSSSSSSSSTMMSNIHSIGNGNNTIMNANNNSTPPYPNPNELIHAIMNGNICKGFPEPPSQRYCNSLSLDLLTIDPHWQLQPPLITIEYSQQQNQQNSCSNNNNGDKCSTMIRQQPSTVTPVIYDQNSNLIDPHEFDLQLKEIEECSQQSISTFFMCLIGHKYRPIALPTVIASDDFQQIFTAAAESGLGDVNLLRSCYKENRNLQPEPHYVLLEPRRASRQYEEELEHIAKLVEYGSKVAAREGLLSNNFGVVMSAVHQQTLHALYCARQYQLGGLVTSPTTMNNNISSNRHHHPHHMHHHNNTTTNSST
ncbi:NACHT and WD repeat domain-containing protein 2 [Dermatophagoides farinae]|uniref:NACHT and WD repeat domain-containing protein 2 n=1 Tax=Dermatophagoides farinae TaxID=6954 RepID=A0A922HTG1_DERFA|nr:NACHT and WD repeat domain-containing protein 2 [Dermatophagoides farinae]